MEAVKVATVVAAIAAEVVAVMAVAEDIKFETNRY